MMGSSGKAEEWCSMARSQCQLYSSGTSWRTGYQHRKQKDQERGDCEVQRSKAKSGAKAGPGGEEGRASGEIQEVESIVQQVPLGPSSDSPSWPSVTPAWATGMATQALCQAYWLLVVCPGPMSGTAAKGRRPGRPSSPQGLKVSLCCTFDILMAPASHGAQGTHWPHRVIGSPAVPASQLSNRTLEDRTASLESPHSGRRLGSCWCSLPVPDL